MQELGVRIIIGKGGLGPASLAAFAELGGVYLAIIGGTAALETTWIEAIEDVDLDDLNPESLWQFRIRDFGPLLVAMDSHGASLYDAVEQPCPAGAEYQDVGPQPRDVHQVLTFNVASAAAPPVAGGMIDRVVQTSTVAVHRDQQRSEIVNAELPEAFRIEVIEVDVLDRVDPRRLQRRRAADDCEIDTARTYEMQRATPGPDRLCR